MQGQSIRNQIGARQSADGIFQSDKVIKYIHTTSPGLINIFNFLSNACTIRIESSESDLQLLEELDVLFQQLQYKQIQYFSSVCRKDMLSQYYRCFDCSKSNSSCYCPKCFQYDRHRGHMITVIEAQQTFCSCGDQNLIKAQSFCKKHKNWKQSTVDSTVMAKYTDELNFLLSLGIAVYDNIEKKLFDVEEQECFLEKVAEFIVKLIVRSQFYQVVFEEVLHQKMNTLLSSKEDLIIDILLRNKWNQEVNKNITTIFTILLKYQRVSRRLLPEILLSLYKQSPILQLGLSSRLALHERSVVEPVISAENISYLVLQKSSSSVSSSLFLLNLYYALHRYNYDLFEKFVFLLIAQSQITKLGNLIYSGEHYGDKNQIEDIYEKLSSVLGLIIDLLAHLPQGSIEKRANLSNIISQSFKLMVSQDEPSQFVVQLFAIAVLVYSNFNLKNLSLIPIQQLKEIFYVKKDESSSTPTKSLPSFSLDFLERQYVSLKDKPQHIFFSRLLRLQTSNITEQTQTTRQEIALNYIIYSTYAILFQTVKKAQDKSFIQEYLCFAEIRNNFNAKEQLFTETSVSQLHLVSSLIKNYIYATESELPSLIIGSQIDPQRYQKEIIALFQDLAAVFHDSSKQQFINQASSWINNQKLLNDFMADEFARLQNLGLRLPTRYHLSFNSGLCFFESAEERQRRFKAKFYNVSKGNYQKVLSNEVIGQLTKFFALIIENCQKNISRGVRDAFNSFFQMFMTIYLIVPSETVLKMIKRVAEDQYLRELLSSRNQQVLKIFQDLSHDSHPNAQHSQHQSHLQPLQPSQIASKKSPNAKMQEKKQKMRQQQTKILSHAKEILGVNLEKEQNICIICRMGTHEQGKLYYLCRLAESNLATRNILKSNKSFLLFTTCGHLIHDYCLEMSWKKDKTSKSGYHCMFCTRKSNIRIPFDLDQVDHPSVLDFLNETKTIRMLQREAQLQQLQHLQSNRIQQEIAKKQHSYKVPGFFGLWPQMQYRGQADQSEEQQEESLKVGEIMLPYHEQMCEGQEMQQIYQAVIYHIYCYYLSHSEAFQDFMLPIVRYLITALRVMALSQESFPCYLPTDMPEDAVVDRIRANLNLMIAGKKENLFQRNSSQQKLSKSLKNSIANIFLQDIDALFMKFAGKEIKLRKIKQLERFNLYKHPSDLNELKRMVKPCPLCSSISDRFYFCLMCDFTSCLYCSIEERMHVLKHHRGLGVQFGIKSGCYQYQFMNKRIKVNSSYRNRHGDSYNSDVKVQVEPGEFMFDAKAFEAIIVDIIMEFIETKLERQASFNPPYRQNCQAQ